MHFHQNEIFLSTIQNNNTTSYIIIHKIQQRASNLIIANIKPTTTFVVIQYHLYIFCQLSAVTWACIVTNNHHKNHNNAPPHGTQIQQDHEGACRSVGKLICQGPVPFFKRLTNFDLYDQMMLKYNICGRAEAQGGMDV